VEATRALLSRYADKKFVSVEDFKS
jgi:hypothetical protein